MAKNAGGKSVLKAGSGKEEPKKDATILGSSKKPVNRNVYEAVGEPAPSRASGRKPVNRNIYEAVGTESKKPGAAGEYYTVGATQMTQVTQVTQARNQVEADDLVLPDSRRESRRQRRMRRLEEERRLMGQTRMIVFGCSCFIALILVMAAVIGGGFMLHLAESKRPKARGPLNILKPLKGNVSKATYGFSQCKTALQPKQDVLNDLQAESKLSACIRVKPAHRSCSVTCERHIFELFQASSEINYESYYENSTNITRRPLSLADILVLKETKVNQPVFCRDDRRKNVQTVCVDGECLHRYVGSPAPHDVLEAPKWVDNCDKKQDCFEDQKRKEFDEMLKLDLFKREKCLERSTTSCKQGMKAVVYLQLMECEMNGDRAHEEFCRSGPHGGMFRLFKCAECNGTDLPLGDSVDPYQRLVKHACEKKNYTHADYENENTCVASCLDAKKIEKYVMLPDGARCPILSETPSDISQDGYCAFGACFIWDGATTPNSTDECLKNKKKREETKTRFH